MHLFGPCKFFSFQPIFLAGYVFRSLLSDFSGVTDVHAGVDWTGAQAMILLMFVNVSMKVSLSPRSCGFWSAHDVGFMKCCTGEGIDAATVVASFPF